MIVLILLISLCFAFCKSDQYAPATDTTFSDAFDTSFSGSGTNYVGEFSVSSNWGTFEMNRETYHGLVYVYQNWDGYDLMNIFSVSDAGNNIGIIYVYCLVNSNSINNNTNNHHIHNNNNNNYNNINNIPSMKIDAIYSENYDHTMTYEQASNNGECTINGKSNTDVSVSFPSLTEAPNVDKSCFDIKVNGTTLNITNGEGLMKNMLDNDYYNIIVFSTVDCSQCGNGGWYELHSFVYNKNNDGNACFGIFYLEFGTTNSVLLEYSLCLPDLTQPDNLYQATWSGKLKSQDYNNDQLENRKFMSVMRHEHVANKYKNTHE